MKNNNKYERINEQFFPVNGNIINENKILLYGFYTNISKKICPIVGILSIHNLSIFNNNTFTIHIQLITDSLQFF